MVASMIHVVRRSGSLRELRRERDLGRQDLGRVFMLGATGGGRSSVRRGPVENRAMSDND